MIDEKKREKPEAEELKEILGVVSTQIPALVKGVIGSIFSEEAGKSMGRAAAAFYNELKESGMPENVAVKMTENYMSVFTSLGDLLKHVGKSGGKENVAIKIEKELAKKMQEKMAETAEEE